MRTLLSTTRSSIECARLRFPFQWLRDYATHLPYGNPFDLRQPARAEEFFRDLFADFEDAKPQDATVRAYEQLLSIYMRVLRETTNWMSNDHRRGGPVGKLIATAAQQADRLTVLTFNHDLVIENELQKRVRLAERWCLDRGYGSLSSGHAIVGATVDTFNRHSPACDHARPIEVLKLHGSLNWYVRMNGRHPSPRVLSGQAQPPPIHVTPGRSIRTQVRFNRPTMSGRGRSRWYTWPIVIPPVHGKEPLIRNFVPTVWADAAKALAASQRLVFYGYSLPELDIRAQRLLQRGIGDNQHVRWIDVINPESESAGRYARLLRPAALRWYPSLDAFLDAGGLRA